MPQFYKVFDHLDRISAPYCLTASSGKATVANNIIWNSTPAFNLSGNAFGTLYTHVSYSDVQGGTNNASLGTKGLLIGGPGNFNLDPRFVNAAATNFHLSAASPCIDAGTNLVGLLATDLDGCPRPLDGNGDGMAVVDMGAFEFDLRTTVPAEAFGLKMNQERLLASDFADVRNFNSPPPRNAFIASLSLEQPLFAPKAYIGYGMAKVEADARRRGG